MSNPIKAYLERIQLHTGSYILHYDSASHDLCAWFWPITDEGERVVPSGLQEHRQTHTFRGPSCLCASITLGGEYTEAAIYKPTGGDFSGEYIAACHTESCGYIVRLERYYPRRALLLKEHYRRDPGEAAPPRVLHFSGLTGLVNRPHSGRGITGVIRSVPTYQQPRRREATTTETLLALNASTRPGLSEKDFQKLFARCKCGLIMTHRVFKRHACMEVVDALASDDSDSAPDTPSPAPKVIDLTSDGTTIY